MKTAWKVALFVAVFHDPLIFLAVFLAVAIPKPNKKGGENPSRSR